MCILQKISEMTISLGKSLAQVSYINLQIIVNLFLFHQILYRLILLIQASFEIEKIHPKINIALMNLFFEIYNCIGAFGEVRLCTHRKTGAKRAVKIIKKSFLQGKEETRFLQEIEILKNMVMISNYSYF